MSTLVAGCLLLLAGLTSRADTVASLLGNFTINQFEGLRVSDHAVSIHYVVVYGQLPALRELHLADADGDGITSPAERDAHVGGLAPGFADGLNLTVDGVRVPLRATHWSSSLPTEQGGFSLRVDMDLAGTLGAAKRGTPRKVAFSNQNYAGRIGWHEIVVTGDEGVVLYDTDAYSSSATNALTEALQSLPAGGPLDERSVHFTLDAVLPPGAVAMGPRAGAAVQPAVADGAASPRPAFGLAESTWIGQKTRNLVAAISAPTLSPAVALWTVLAALALGAVHALSPGHGKTIVGAYLIGSRGTPRHAAFLGFTVTVTHTLGVFVVGFATLYASKYIVPEKLFPILSMISALLILGMGVVLLVQRVRTARLAFKPAAAPDQPVFFPMAAPAGGGVVSRGLMFSRAHSHDHVHSHGEAHGHAHAHADGTLHSHGGGPLHSHLPPGARGERVTWKSLLTLGISGGLVPCPSAMVLLLAAIALNKTAYGMLLVLIFSVGLAITLTLVGLAFLYARNRFSRGNSEARWAQWLPVLSAFTITVLGVALFVGALRTFS